MTMIARSILVGRYMCKLKALFRSLFVQQFPGAGHTVFSMKCNISKQKSIREFQIHLYGKRQRQFVPHDEVLSLLVVYYLSYKNQQLIHARFIHGKYFCSFLNMRTCHLEFAVWRLYCKRESEAKSCPVQYENLSDMHLSTLEIGAARRSLALLQKSRRNHRFYV